MDTSDEWIRSRVGIASRRIAGPDETVVGHGRGGRRQGAGGQRAGAGRRSTWSIVATCTMPSADPERGRARWPPGSASRRPGAYDLNAACAGFCYGLSAAAARGHLRRRPATCCVIGAEKLTDWVDPDDRSTAIIFADGAGAAVVGPAAHPGRGRHRPGGLGQRRRAGRTPITSGTATPFLGQEGQAVFRWATTALAPGRAGGLRAGRDRAHRPGRVRPAPGQPAHHRGDRPQARRARTRGSPTDIVEAGNTSSASIPLALARMVERGEVRSGAPVLLLGFGAGLTYAGQVVLCP